MKGLDRMRISRSALPVVLVIGLLAGCSGAKQPANDPDSGLELTYGMPEGQILKYESVLGFEELVELRGRTTGMSTTTNTEFTVAAQSGSDEGHQLSIMIDMMESVVDAMGREIPRPVGEVIGKSFELNLTPRGEVQSMSGTEELQYRVGPFGLRSIETDFNDLFPVLPDRPVKVGESWSTKNEITDVRDATITYHLTSVNTFAGTETVNGVECAKVTASVTGTMEGEARNKSTDITFEGSYEGSDLWFFAYDDGKLISRESLGRVTGKAFDERANAGEGMTVPMTRKISARIKLVE